MSTSTAVAPPQCRRISPHYPGLNCTPATTPLGLLATPKDKGADKRRNRAGEWKCWRIEQLRQKQETIKRLALYHKQTSQCVQDFIRSKRHGRNGCFAASCPLRASRPLDTTALLHLSLSGNHKPQGSTRFAPSYCIYYSQQREDAANQGSWSYSLFSGLGECEA